MVSNETQNWILDEDELYQKHPATVPRVKFQVLPMLEILRAAMNTGKDDEKSLIP